MHTHVCSLIFMEIRCNFSMHFQQNGAEYNLRINTDSFGKCGRTGIKYCLLLSYARRRAVCTRKLQSARRIETGMAIAAL